MMKRLLGPVFVAVLLPFSAGLAGAEVGLAIKGQGAVDLRVSPAPLGPWSPMGPGDSTVLGLRRAVALDAWLSDDRLLLATFEPGLGTGGGIVLHVIINPIEEPQLLKSIVLDSDVGSRGGFGIPGTPGEPIDFDRVEPGSPRVLEGSEGWWVAWSDRDGRSVVLLDPNGEVSGRMTDASDAHLVGAWTLGKSLQLLELDTEGRLSLVVYGYVPGPIPIEIAHVSRQDLALAPAGLPAAAVSLRQVVISVDGSGYLAWQFGGESTAGFVRLGESGATSDRQDLELRAQPKSDTTAPLEAALRREVR